MKQVYALGSLLALTLIGAFSTWNAEPESAPEGVAIYHADADDLKAVRYEQGDELIVEIQRLSDASGPYFQVEVTDTKPVRRREPPNHPPTIPEEAAGHDAGDEAEEPAEELTPEVETSVIRFIGGERAEELWSSFAPLMAIRELPSASSVDVYGLDEPEAQLTITRRSGDITLSLGDESYGTKHRYVQLAGGSSARNFLLDSKLTRQIQGAKTTLVEKRLHPISESDLTRVDIVSGSRNRSLVQTNRDDKTKAYWADHQSPDTEDVQGGTWLARFLRVRVHAYPKPDSDPGPLSPAFQVRVHDQTTSWEVTVLATADEEPEYYAQSAFNRGLVKLPTRSVDDTLADLDELMRGPSTENADEPEAIEPEPPQP